jgi:hypothetical protein
MKKKRNNPRESARTTIASIKREMQKPRLTESVRNDGRDQVAPVAECAALIIGPALPAQ